MKFEVVIGNAKNNKDKKTFVPKNVQSSLIPQKIETKNPCISPSSQLKKYIDEGNKLLEIGKYNNDPVYFLKCEEQFLKADKILHNKAKSNYANSDGINKYSDFQQHLLKLYYHMGFTEYCGNIINITTCYDKESLDIFNIIQEKTENISKNVNREKYISEAKHTVALYPNHWAAHSNLGMIYKAYGLYEESQNSYNTADKLSPHNGIIKFGLGETILFASCQASETKNDYQEYSETGLIRAKKILLEAVECKYKNTDLYYYLGGIAYQLANLANSSKKSISDYDKLLLYRNEVIPNYEKALSIDGNNCRALNNLYKTYIELSDIASIDKILNDASERTEVKDVKYWLNLGSLYVEWNHDIQKVKECLDLAYKNSPSDSFEIAAYSDLTKKLKELEKRKKS